jgi:hypothetical protein
VHKTTALLLCSWGLAAAGPLTFSVGGTFNADQPSSAPYFEPAAAWSLTLTVASVPTVLNSGTSPSYSYFLTTFTNAVYTVGGSVVPIDGNQIIFYSSQMFAVCLDSACVHQLAFAGPRLFSGEVSRPTLSSGSYSATRVQSSILQPGAAAATISRHSGTTVDIAGSADAPQLLPLLFSGLALATVSAEVGRRSVRNALAGKR